MGEHPATPAKRRFERREITDRRQNADMPQPLDYVTKELVSEFIENQKSAAKPQKSFFQKLLKNS